MSSSPSAITAVIFLQEVGLTRPRFTAFLKANLGFLCIEGHKRSVLYSLKG